MKKIKTPLVVLLLIVVTLTLCFPRQVDVVAAARPAPDSTPTFAASWPTGQTDAADHHADVSVRMPDLIGMSLDFATSIWEEDEGLPQIQVIGPTNNPDLVIVRQQPEPGTMIVPSETRIVLTLGKGPVKYPPSAPTPLPPAQSLAVLGQATLLRPPYVQNLTTTSVTIVWTTVEAGASEVHFGVSDASMVVPAVSTYVTTPAVAPYGQYYIHEATLQGLTPDTGYQYQIFTNGADLTPGGMVTFRSAKPSTTNSFRFAVFGDSGDGTQSQKDVATRLLQVQPDIVLHTGDIAYPEGSYESFELYFFQIYKDLIKSTWIAPAAGNHDVKYNKGKTFTDVFVNPTNATKATEKELYYSFDYGNAHYTVLNNYFGMTNVSSAQYSWLVNDLATTNQFWKFVVFHEPPYSTDPYQQPRDKPAIISALVPLFEKYNVDIVFGGHLHYYERMYPLLGGNVSTIENGGVVYIVTGGGGGDLSGTGSGTLYPRTAAKVRKNHFTMVDVQSCSLTLSGVQKVSGTTDNFDPTDIFDTYTMNRCGSSGTPVPTSSPTMTNTPTRTRTPTSTLPGTSTATNTPTRTFTPGPTSTRTPTHTPTQTFTSTSTNTAGPTFTPTLTFTPSPTSSFSDLIFKDGFESGNFTAWSANVTNAGNLSVSANAALAGSSGLQAAFINSSGMYVRDDSPSAESRYRVRFYFDPNSISMASGTHVYLLQAHDTSMVVLFVQFYRSSTSYQLRVRAHDSVVGNYVNTPFVNITDAMHSVEVDWGNDGHVTLWIDGVQQGSLTGLNNSAYKIESVRFGAPYMSATAPTGNYFLDAFESRRQTYIGP